MTELPGSLHLYTGDSVLVRTDKEQTWEPAVVMQEHGSPRSYLVDNGQSVLRCNRVHLQPTIAGARQDAESVGPCMQTPGVAVEPSPSVVTCVPEVASSPTVVTTPAPRRSQRSTRGTLPSKFADFEMSA